MAITIGVPQGLVLGPLLFLLYINDIQYCSELVSVILFADDTNVLYSHTCFKTLNEILQIEMKKITNWLNVNKLSLNTTKTKFILFRSRNKKSKHDLNISINEENIKQVKNITFLGIVIHEFLTWRDHIDLISKKNYQMCSYYFQNPTFYKLKFSKTDLLCIGLSISYLW